MGGRRRSAARPWAVLALVALAVLLMATPAPQWLGWREGTSRATPAATSVPSAGPGATAAHGGRWSSGTVTVPLPAAPPLVPPAAGPGTTTSTTSVPPPAPAPASPAPPPPPADPAGADPGGDPGVRVLAALQSSVPPAWRAALPLRLGLRPGSESRAYTDGRIEVSVAHATGPWDRLRAIVAHEVAHQVAFRFGTAAYLGAAPGGWVPAGPVPAERWADCAATALTGVVLASHGLPPCTGAQLDSAAAVLDAGPPAV